MLFPMLLAEWLHLVITFSTEYNNSSFWKYLVDIKSDWLNLFWEYINENCLQCVGVKNISYIDVWPNTPYSLTWLVADM
jgi:hypothetical protein